jgi:hypothetical protein
VYPWKCPDLLFINQNMDASLHEKIIELFDGNLNSLNDDLVHEVEQFFDSNNKIED